jgi:Na+-transporting methylmalonyl-CoA/oxaloacetate decarboxylase beta subunit
MKKYFIGWNVKKHALLSMILSSVLVFLLRAITRNQTAASIGIIGGADGPTAIFISSKLFSLDIIAILFLALFIIFMVLYGLIKRLCEGNRQNER